MVDTLSTYALILLITAISLQTTACVTPMAEERDEQYWQARKHEPLSELGLSDEAFSELHERGLRTIGQLLQHTQVDLITRISGPRKLIMEEIKNKNVILGMRLEDVPEYELVRAEPDLIETENRSIYKHDETRSLEQVLNSLAEVISSMLPTEAKNWLAPATPVEIERLQKELGIALPEELITLLTFENREKIGFLPHQYELLSVDEIIEQRQIHIDNQRSDKDFYKLKGDNLYEAIQPTTFHEEWVPFASVDRDTLYVDLAPSKQGIKGQIITSDMYSTKWLSKDLIQFFGQLDAGLKAGWYYPTVPGDFPAIYSKGKAWFQMGNDD